MSNAQSESDPSILLTPGERLGWVFRDRNLLRRPFTEPIPAACAPLPFHLVNSVQLTRAKMPLRMAIAGGVSVVVAGCITVGNSIQAFALAGLTVLAGLGVIGLIGMDYSNVQRRVASAEARRRWFYADWERRRAAYIEAEQQRVDQLLEWASATPAPGTQRLDIVGGNLWGWEALLTVYGASLLATRGAMTLIDLSGEAVSRELLQVADGNGTSVDALLLPDQLDQSDLLVGLSTRELADTLIESIYSSEQSASRADRAMDDRILSWTCSTLNGHITIGRITEALQALMNEPTESSALTSHERRVIADGPFSDEYRRQSHGNLRRLESLLHQLVGLGSRQQPRPAATLTCLALATDGRNVRNELLNDLIVQWLIRRIAHDTADMSSLVIAGADEVPRRHIERLSDLCERRDVRLVLLFRHLRDSALQTLGGGTVGFMRLGNHEEARHAADHIGREHKFVLSQLTQTLGGNNTHTEGDGQGRSTTKGRTTGRGASKSWSVTRNWNTTRSLAEGSNWSNAASHQRVYEYTIEPLMLQSLPDYAMLMVQRANDGRTIVPVECNPDLISMPRLSMEPLSDEPRQAHPAGPLR